MNRYERHRTARRLDNERRLMGESLEAFHARENAKPPTLAEVYRTHPRVRCERTPNLFDGRTDGEKKNPPGLFDRPKG